MSTQSIAEFFQAAAGAVAALRLFQLGLHRSQPALFTFLCVAAASLSTLASIEPTSRPYFLIFIGFTVLFWMLSVAAVREIFALALKDYQGIATAVRWAIQGCFTVSLAVSLGVSWLAWNQGPTGHSLPLFLTESINRSVMLTLAVFIAIFLAVLSRYPLHLQRNTFISCGFFGALFLSEALATLADTLSPRLFSPPVDITHLVVSTLCLVGWAVLLRRESAEPRPAVYSRPNEMRLLQELEAMNAVLTRAGRK